MTPLALLLAVAAPVPKEEKVDFTWRFTKGDVFYLTHTADSDARITSSRFASAVDRITRRTEMVWKVTVAAAGADGVTLALEAVAYRGSAVANTGKLVGVKEVDGTARQKFSLQFDAAHRLMKVTGGEGWDKAMAKQGQLSATHTAKEVAREFEHLLRAVPAGRQGGEWTTKTETADPDVKAADTWTRRAKLAGVKDGTATVTFSTDLEGKKDENRRSIFDPYERKAEKCPGTFTFDTRTGRVEAFEESLSITGYTGGKDQAIGYACTVKTTFTLSAKPPKAD